MISLSKNNTLDRPRKEKQSRKNPSVRTPLPTPSRSVHDKSVWLHPLLSLNTTDIDNIVIDPLWKRVLTLYEVDFTSRSPTNPRFLPGSTTRVTGASSHYSNMPTNPWEDVESEKNHPVVNIRQRDEQNRCDDSPNSMVVAIACGDCLASVFFEDQIVTKCSAIVTKSEGFVREHIEVGAGTGSALLLNEFEI